MTPDAVAFARALGEAETKLRAHGLTGTRAFAALRDTLLARAGQGGEPHPALEDLALPDAELDLLGLAYERFFPDLFKGRLGQFFTPRSIVRLLLSRVPLAPGTRVLDPTCGSGGLLVLAAREGVRVQGMDIDPHMVDLAQLHLTLAGRAGDVRQADFFRADPVPVDVVIANPPFSVPVVDPEVLARYTLHRQLPAISDVLFLEALERWVRPGGHAALVLPWTIVANRSMEPLRERIDAEWCRRALCVLPEGVFRPFGGAAGRAALLWLQRRPAEDGFMEWAVLDDPGFDTRTTRLVATSSAEVDRLVEGRGWRPIAGWMPHRREVEGCRLGDWVQASKRTHAGGPDQWTVDLADVDRLTGELRPRRADSKGRRASLEPGQVLVAKMRPELGNVSIVPPDVHAGGSSEWIRLECRHPHFLFHALRGAGWRAQLPPTTGQTRPRTDVGAVLDTRVRRPSEDTLDAVETLSSQLLEQRRHLQEKLAALESAVQDFVEDGDEPRLRSRLTALEGASGGLKLP